MNSKKYDGVYYEGREVNDLKQIIWESTDMFPESSAYLVKDRSVGKFVPITYQQVREDVEAYGTRLVDMGLKGKKIAVIGETSYHWLLTYFAVVCGVGVIVPLDKNLPEGELMGLIERSGAEAIVYSPKCEKTIKTLFEDPKNLKYFISMEQEENDEKIFSLRQILREGRELLENGNRDYIDVEIDPDQMSTIIFTSGTTGMAKGVMLSHRNIAQQCYQMSKFFKIPEPGIVLSILPVHHVYEMTCDIWTTFYQGKTIAICEGIRYIQKNMNEVHANVMLGVPLVFEKMYKGMWKQAKRRGEDEKLRKAIDLSKKFRLYNNHAVMKKMFASIHNSFGGDMKKFVVGGAAADPYIIEEFEAMGLPMVQGYGMSENAPIIALNPDRYRKASSVGKPLPGTKVRVVDQDEDGIGEIICKGPSVMLGYYENQEATEEAFQNGWLRTGDLGYFDNDGFLYVTGRKKTVIVTKGGKNIFPEEVEDVLLQNDLIKEVLVHGVKDERVGNVMITADIYPDYELLKEQQGEMNKSDIYHFYRDLVDEINESMPPYKQVRRINIRAEAFAKTTTGKVKRFGNTLEKGESIESMDYQDIKKMEIKAARSRARELCGSEDTFVRHRKLQPVTDLRHMISESERNFGARTAVSQRMASDSAYVERTYSQLKGDIDGLGTGMMNLGLGGRIALLGKTSYEWQVAFLSIVGGVGAAVPMDANLEKERILRQLAEAKVSCVIAEESGISMLKEILDSGETEVKTLIAFGPEDDVRKEDKDGVLSFRRLMEAGQNQAAQGDRQYLDAEVVSGDAALILYTAGEGKAVMLSHDNIVFDLMSVSTMLEIREEDRVFSPLLASKVYQCTLGFLLPLYKGAAVINGTGNDRLTEDMRESRPTVFMGEPEMIRTLQDQMIDGLPQRRKERMRKAAVEMEEFGGKMRLAFLKPLASEMKKNVGGELRTIVSVGGNISPGLLDFFNGIGITTIRGYCLAECAPVAAINPDDPKTAKNASCGHLLPGTAVKIVGRNASGIGEIWLKGPNVMLGYYGDEALTAKSITNGWLKTGDYGYIDENKFIYLVNPVLADKGDQQEDETEAHKE